MSETVIITYCSTHSISHTEIFLTCECVNWESSAEFLFILLAGVGFQVFQASHCGPCILHCPLEGVTLAAPVTVLPQLLLRTLAGVEMERILNAMGKQGKLL